ncbi:MAG: MurR/RpiR family transcriptional regulator [Chloroflexota bacterium]
MTQEIENKQPNSLAQIRSKLLALSTAETQVATWILHNPKSAMHSSMAQIASACGVSDTTVLRFCRNVGFRGFTDLKISLAQDLANPTQLIHDDIAPDDGPMTVARKVFLANIQALYDTLDMLDETAINQIIALLDQAKQILIVGVGVSAPIAMGAYHKLFRLGLPCIVPTDSHLQLMQAALLGPDDLVIAISHSGETRDPLAIVKEAKQHGARTVCITTNAQSPLTENADIVLLSVSQETRSDVISARVAQTTIIDTLQVIFSLKYLNRSIETEKRILDAIISQDLLT